MYLCRSPGAPFCCPAKGVKRERGVNPRQTRCCELILGVPQAPIHCFVDEAGRSGTKASQKTCP